MFNYSSGYQPLVRSHLEAGSQPELLVNRLWITRPVEHSFANSVLDCKLLKGLPSKLWIKLYTDSWFSIMYCRDQICKNIKSINFFNEEKG